MACWNLLKLTGSTLTSIKRQGHVLTTLSWLVCTLFMQKACIDHEIWSFLQSMQNLIHLKAFYSSFLVHLSPIFLHSFLLLDFLFKWYPHKTKALSQRYVISFQPTPVKFCSLHKFNILKWLILFLLILIRTLAYRETRWSLTYTQHW